MELKVIDTAEGVATVQAYLADKEFIAVDFETTGTSNKAEVIGVSVCAEETIAYYIILAAWDAAEKKLIYKPYREQVTSFIADLKTKKLIMHNATFDCMIADAYFKINLINAVHTDTMILAHLLDENRRVGLKELATQYFGEDAKKEAEEMKASVHANGGTTTKVSYEMYKADPYILGKYGAKDALLTLKLFYELVPELYEQGLEDFFYKEESMPLLKGPTFELNTTGVCIDTKKLLTLRKQLEAECAEAKSFIHQEIYQHVKEKYPATSAKTTFNIEAPQQLSWLLYGQLSLEPDSMTKAGKAMAKLLTGKIPYTKGAKNEFIRTCIQRQGEVYELEAVVNGKTKRAKKIAAPWGYLAADKDALKKLAPKYKWIERLLEYKKKKKLLNTYVEGIEDKVQYGVIYPSFLQHGTSSGRYSSRSPNWQNLPRDDKRIKDCVVARPGKVFVGADYSQLEPRCFAYYSGDERLKESFSSGADFYSVVGIEVYDKFDAAPLKEGVDNAFGILYPKLRQDSKVFTLAATYGATANRLGPLMGKSTQDAAEDLAAYFEKFPKVRQYMLDMHKMAKTQGFVTNLFGRKRRMPDAKRIPKLYGDVDHSELPYDVRGTLNLAVNHPIQSTGASIVNRAAIRFTSLRKELGIDCRMVAQVHDSLVIECNEADAENVALLLQECMENTVKLDGVALEAVPKQGKTLADV